MHNTCRLTFDNIELVPALALSHSGKYFGCSMIKYQVKFIVRYFTEIYSINIKYVFVVVIYILYVFFMKVRFMTNRYIPQSKYLITLFYTKSAIQIKSD